MEKNSNLFIIVTVPHASGCDEFDFNPHPCDYYATKMAREIANASRSAGLDLEGPLVATIPRSTSDMNRKESRNSPFRKHIIDVIKQKIAEKKNVWVIDTHSFPSDYKYNTKQKNVDFVVLDTRDSGNSTPYVVELINYMTSSPNEIVIEDVRGSDSTGQQTNDIMDTSRKLLAKSFLIETREQISDSIMKIAAKKLIQFIVYYEK
jgi:predicted N-formylglutamate amidohydrolase